MNLFIQIISSALDGYDGQALGSYAQQKVIGGFKVNKIYWYKNLFKDKVFNSKDDPSYQNQSGFKILWK